MKNNFETELDKIRVKLYEETKHMTVEEHTQYVNDKGRKLASEFGFTIAEPTKTPYVKVKTG